MLPYHRIGAPARVGLVAPIDVVVPPGNTGLDPSQTSFFQVLNIPTKINKGTVEIITPVELIKKGQNVLAVAIATEYTFPQAEKVKEYLKDPSKFVVATASVAVATGTAAAPAVAAKEEEKEEEPAEESDEDMRLGPESDAEAVMRSLSLNSPKNGGVRAVSEAARYREKPLQCVSPKSSPRRVIHQPH